MRDKIAEKTIKCKKKLKKWKKIKKNEKKNEKKLKKLGIKYSMRTKNAKSKKNQFSVQKSVQKCNVIT